MRRGRSLKILSIVALFIAIAGLTVAYAAMSETLKVTGSAVFESATWNVKFTNLNATKKGQATYNLPTISDTSLSNYSVVLKAPGDAVEFTFDVENAGTLDAILGTLSKGNPVCTGSGATATADANLVCGNLVYSLTYADGSSVANNDLLNHDSSKAMKLTLAYPSTATQLPTNVVTITGLDITMIYNQN